ncbi:MAG: wax ester/triacylglycerol synthase family O-acyltransferase [Nevskia sp.]|nr:wax ester/triacylglycerol synthase family O-acyltransferase [Nevskia sp.]
MQRLSGLDAAFLSVETDTVPMHVGALLVVDPRGAPGFGFEAVREAMQQRMHVMPAFRRRPVEAPLNLIHPFWVEDPEFRIDRHLKRATVPAPGTHAELEQLAARLFEPRLQRDRPLWEIYYIDGLASGEVACLWKMHHACLDGVLGAELFARALDTSANALPPAPAREWVPDRMPGRMQLAWRTVRSAAAAPRRMIGLAGETAAALRTLMAARSAPQERGAEKAPAQRKLPMFGPRTCFNTMVTAKRSYAFGTLPLDAVRSVKTVFGGTVNDVVLALCGEAARRYLLKYGELPDRPLVAAVPLSLRGKDDMSPTNRVTIARVNMATDVADPVERLRAISARMNRVKHVRKSFPTKVMMDWIDLPMPAMLSRVAKLNESYRGMDHLQMPFNLVVSNIVGPQAPMYLAGARLQALYPMSIAYHGLGINITLMSYCDALNVGITAHPETVPDVDYFFQAMRKSLDELLERSKTVAPQPVADAV